MFWQIYLIISIALLSLNGLFHRSLMKGDKSDSRAQAVVFLGIGGIFAIFIALIQGKLQFVFPVFLIWNFILLVVLSTPAYLLAYRSYQLIGASEVVLFLVTGRLWNVVGATLFLHESITAIKILGAVIILIGIGIVLYDKKKFTFNKGVIFALLAAFLFGMSDINGFYILQKINAASFLVYAELLPVIALLFLQPKIVKKLTYYFQKDNAIKVALLALFDVFGMLALFLAYQTGGKASVIGPLSATRVLITVVLAMLIFKERNNITNKIIGAVVTLIGVILLL